MLDPKVLFENAKELLETDLGDAIKDKVKNRPLFGKGYGEKRLRQKTAEYLKYLKKDKGMSDQPLGYKHIRQDLHPKQSLKKTEAGDRKQYDPKFMDIINKGNKDFAVKQKEDTAKYTADQAGDRIGKVKW